MYALKHGGGAVDLGGDVQENHCTGSANGTVSLFVLAITICMTGNSRKTLFSGGR